ncbi:MAG: nucleoside deaminase [Oscillospiraceae bacterium]|nr:nucleoside deaminase [Oscillospiraceae bacterium]
MRYQELDASWKRIFELEWLSLCEKSKAIVALIVSDEGEILSEGRNQTGEAVIPNPRVCHAETEAIRNLDILKYPHVKAYTLYTALEPCPMYLGTMVMGRIRNIVIAAKDAYGGAMGLLEQSAYLKGKNINIVWMPQEYGDAQRGFQTLRELLYNTDEERLQRMLADFSVYNKKGVQAAKNLITEGLFEDLQPDAFSAEEIIDKLMLLMAK